MKKILPALLLFFGLSTFAQTLEWRLVPTAFSSLDPDGAGEATGSVRFTLQMHTTGGVVNDVTQISTGYSYQDATAMVPTNPGCTISAGTPANIVLSPAFATAGFAYTTVNQCNIVSPAISTGGQSFDRRAMGTLDNGSIDIGADWVDVFTVTLWTKKAGQTGGGYVILNSSEGGAPGAYTTYSISNMFAQQFPANSQSFTVPLALINVTLPVQFTRFTVQCSPMENRVSWNTTNEKDNSHFVIEKSVDGSNWSVIAKVYPNSNNAYEFIDREDEQMFYRVQQISLNGASVYTEIARTNCVSRSFDVNLYPKPAVDRLTLTIKADVAVNTSVQVIDNYGCVVMSMPVVIVKGTNAFQLNIGHLPQGQYYLKSMDVTNIVNQRFTIVR